MTNETRINFDSEKTQIVDIGLVHPNKWNPKSKEETPAFVKVQRSIQTHGQRAYPIIVREDGDQYEIIDGEQRWTACKNLKFSEVLIYNEGQVDDQEAQELTIWYQQQVPFDRLKEAEMIQSMLDSYESPQLPYDPDEIQRILDRAAQVEEFTKNDEESEVRTLHLLMGKAQFDFVMGVIDQCMKSADLASQSYALEMICAEFASGA